MLGAHIVAAPRRGIIHRLSAAQDSPESALLWHMKAKLLMRQDKWAEAAQALDVALNLDPERCGAWISKGNVLLDWAIQGMRSQPLIGRSRSSPITAKRVKGETCPYAWRTHISLGCSRVCSLAFEMLGR